MNTSNINLNELYFEYKVLQKIIGKLNFDKLHKVFRQLKANTAAVPCTLTGGANGYFGIIFSTTQYHIVAPGTPLVAPTPLEALVTNSTATQYQIMVAKDLHTTTLREHQIYMPL